MKSTDYLCCVVLTITVTASCVGAEVQKDEIDKSQAGKRISKREATVILDNFPEEIMYQKPKMIYRRFSKLTYGPPKSKYGASRPKFRPPKENRNLGKKGRKGKPKRPSPKYGLPQTKYNSHPNKMRPSRHKPKYGPPKTRPYGWSNVVKMSHYVVVPEKKGFGEPPAPHTIDFSSLKQSYGEPPVDSYGDPLKHGIKDAYLTPQETSQMYNIHRINRQRYQWNHSDTDSVFRNKEPSYSNNEIFVTPTPIDDIEESLDTDAPDKHPKQDKTIFFKKKRQFRLTDSKFVNKPWKQTNLKDLDDEIIVGGQYAEPPARYMPKIYENNDDEDTFNTLPDYVDYDSFSANKSPYSNYKHSNMAFSPQNLNDVFSS